MIMQKTPISGTSNINKLPKILAYPQLVQLSTVKELIYNKIIYVIKHYGNNGISVLILKKDNQIIILCGDWYGNSIDLSVVDGKYTSICVDFLNNHVQKFIELMKLIKLDQAQYYFAIHDDELILVDVQISLNKFVSPGMLKDIFSKIFKTQDVLKVELYDDRSVEYIMQGVGSYAGDLIIKPNKFALYSIDSGEIPLYAEIKR